MALPGVVTVYGRKQESDKNISRRTLGFGRGSKGFGFYKQHCCWQLKVLSSAHEFHFKKTCTCFPSVDKKSSWIMNKTPKLMWKSIWLYLRNFPVSHFRTVNNRNSECLLTVFEKIIIGLWPGPWSFRLQVVCLPIGLLAPWWLHKGYPQCYRWFHPIKPGPVRQQPVTVRSNLKPPSQPSFFTATVPSVSKKTKTKNKRPKKKLSWILQMVIKNPFWRTPDNIYSSLLCTH